MRSAVIWRSFTGSFPSPGHHSMPIASEPLVLCSTFIVCVSNYVKLMFGPQRCLFGVDKYRSFTGPKRVVFSSPNMPELFPAEWLPVRRGTVSFESCNRCNHGSGDPVAVRRSPFSYLWVAGLSQVYYCSKCSVTVVYYDLLMFISLLNHNLLNHGPSIKP